MTQPGFRKWDIPLAWAGTAATWTVHNFNEIISTGVGVVTFIWTVWRFADWLKERRRERSRRDE